MIRYRLRTLLIVTTAIAALLGLYKSEIFNGPNPLACLLAIFIMTGLIAIGLGRPVETVFIVTGALCLLAIALAMMAVGI